MLMHRAGGYGGGDRHGMLLHSPRRSERSMLCSMLFYVHDSCAYLGPVILGVDLRIVEHTV